MPLFGMCLAEVPYHPQVGEVLESAQCLGIAIGRFEYDTAAQCTGHTPLPWDAKLAGKVCMHARDNIVY